MDVEKFRDMFLVEATEHLQAMVEELLKLDVDPDDVKTIDALFREAHSIKGMAATMEYPETAGLAHHLEDELDNCRQKKSISKDQIDRILEATDLLEALLDDVRQGRPERSVEGFLQGVTMISPPSRESAAERSPDDTDKQPGSVRLRLALKETVAAPGPRLLVVLNQLKQLGRILNSEPSEEALLGGVSASCLEVELETVRDQADLQLEMHKFSDLEEISFPQPLPESNEQSRKVSLQTVRINTDLLDQFVNLTGELITNRYQLQNSAKQRNWTDLDEGLGQLTRLIKNLHHQVLQVRMISLESLVPRLTRTVHDLCRSSGKEVQLNLSGMELELDRAIVEGLVSPLSHMVRNAVDHGLEEKGTISIKAWRERDQVLLQFQDDGRGLDVEKIRRTALARGLLSASQAKAIRDYDLYQLICHPGFSTRDDVSNLSGRGVGMDVVKTAVERLGGVLLIDSTPGLGTRLTLKLPLSLSIIRALMVDCADMRLALPITRVLKTVEVTSAEIQSSGRQLMIDYLGDMLPLLSLRKILNCPKGDASGTISVVITDVLGRRVGLVVDRLIHQREIFVQRLPAPFDRIRGCHEGTILGDGRIVFLLDLQSLLEKRRS